MPSLYQTPISALRGVGDKRQAQLKKLGVTTIGELLECYPRTYEDWSHPLSLGEAVEGEVCVVKATVLEPVTVTRISGNRTLYRTVATDGEQDMKLTFFNNRYLPSLLKAGETYLFYGKVSGTPWQKEMVAPQFLPAETAPPLVPIYHQTEGLTSRQLQALVAQALALLPKEIPDPIPPAIREQFQLCDYRFALEQMHRPTSLETLKQARNRLLFAELLEFQLGLLLLKERNRGGQNTHMVKNFAKPFWQSMPFTPTNAQQRVVTEALTDMLGQKPMNRLVEGDVGSGKTAVAACLCYCTIKSGFQCAFMAPTEILAKQHYQNLAPILTQLGCTVVLLTGSLTPKQKRQRLQEIATGAAQLVIGTHALLSEAVQFADLGLVITDEQHRFGVHQRATLAQKGNGCHQLVMSATPIPRTLALMLYGDLDLSILDEKPKGRQEIATYLIDSTKRMRAYGYLRRHVQQGYQCYLVCPLIEESETGMQSVLSYAETLQSEIFPDLAIGVLHGKLKPNEKDAVMEQFAEGKLQLLCATTVVEVGVDVKNAVVMLIENAERYGLSQLHQLRGRVGRGSVSSSCILISDSKNPDTQKRLQSFCKLSDGFAIAELDLQMRGPGDFFGKNQHGLPTMKLSSLTEDLETLTMARDTAQAILKADSTLSLPEHRGLKGAVKRLFAKTGDVGLN